MFWGEKGLVGGGGGGLLCFGLMECSLGSQAKPWCLPDIRPGKTHETVKDKFRRPFRVSRQTEESLRRAIIRCLRWDAKP